MSGRFLALNCFLLHNIVSTQKGGDMRRLLNDEKRAIQELYMHFLSVNLAMLGVSEENTIPNKTSIEKLGKLFKDLDTKEFRIIRDIFVTIWEVLYKRPFLKKDQEKICQEIELMLETGVVSLEIKELCSKGYAVAVSWRYGDDIRPLHNPMS